jgi:hypothetical protein
VPVCVVIADAGWAAAVSGVAHSEQNFAPGTFVVPHDGQVVTSGVAHSAQNFAPGRLSVPQFGQVKWAMASG